MCGGKWSLLEGYMEFLLFWFFSVLCFILFVSYLCAFISDKQMLISNKWIKPVNGKYSSTEDLQCCNTCWYWTMSVFHKLPRRLTNGIMSWSFRVWKGLCRLLLVEGGVTSGILRLAWFSYVGPKFWLYACDAQTLQVHNQFFLIFIA